MLKTLKSVKYSLKFFRPAGIGLIILFFLAISSDVAFGQCQKKRTREILDKGTELFNRQNYAGALERYERALQNEPQCALAFFNKGQTLRKLNRIDEAIGAFERAVNLNYSDKAALYLALAASYLNKGKDFAKDALTYGSQAVEVDRHSVDGWYIVAIANQTLGRLPDEISAWTQAVRLTPNNAEFRRSKAVAHYRLKEYKDSLAEFEKLTEIEPNNVFNYVALSDIYRTIGQNQQSVEAAQRALRIKPDAANAFYALGNSYLAVKKYDDASKAFQQAVSYKTDYPAESLYHIGVAQLALGNYNEAVSVLQRALREPVKLFLPEAFKNYVFKALSSSYGQLGNYREAINYLEQAKKITDTDSDVDADIDLSWWYSLLGDNQSAVKAAARAIEKAPKKPSGYTNRCRAYLSLGNADSALQDCETALGLEPNDGETLFYLGRALREKKRIRDADATNKKAIAALEKEIGVKNTDREVVTNRMAGRPVSNNGASADDVNQLMSVRVTSPYTPYILGNAYFDDKQLPKAVSAYQLSISRAPQFSLARLNLGIVYLVLNNKTAAMEQYRELARIDAKRAEELKNFLDARPR